jgi:hydrophobic/amphiphilic exporter-1 (mainly G- bacteria), HAE1 family
VNVKLIELSTRQPITVIVGVLFSLLAGVVAIQSVAIEMTPSVEDTIIAVTTRWENASPQEIESEIVDPQEEKLQGLSNLRNITSTSSLGSGQIRLEFNHGIDKNVAMREVSDKLREVPSYPENVDEPVVEASDPESQDYIAWYVLSCSDDSFDMRELLDFAEDQIKPSLERVSGMSEVNVLGGMEREAQVIIDHQKMSQHKITVAQLVSALRDSNRNDSAGALPMGKLDIRLRSVGRFTSPQDVKDVIITYGSAGPVRVKDIAEVMETFKEPSTFVRSKGHRSLAFNFQREPGTNVLEIMEKLAAVVAEFNKPGGLIDNKTKELGLKAPITFNIVYDATHYISQAIDLVMGNIYIGGGLAIVVLLLFLRSLRSVGIIAISIPVSMVGSIVLMVMLGRTVNVISLAGIAFSVGMVVDNSIVVLENIYRHLEMGKKRLQASLDGTLEVAGAVLASTLTTVIVFIPILLITDQVGQLFRDIALSITTSVAVSFVVSITVIPSACSRILNHNRYLDMQEEKIGWYERFIQDILKSAILRLGIVICFVVISIGGSMWLKPPMDYLPKGNRNITFGLMMTPPGLHLDQLESMGKRVEAGIRPYWEKTAELQPVPMPYTGQMVTPPGVQDYFLVSRGGVLFHGCISSDDRRAVDNVALMTYASRPEILPGVFSFAFQFPLFRLGGSTGSAVKINLVGDDLDQVSASAGALFGTLMQTYGPGTVRPDPGNFNLKVQELQLHSKDEPMAQAGLNRRDMVLAMQAAGDGIWLGDYQQGNDLIDLKVRSREGLQENSITQFGEVPILNQNGQLMRLDQVADLKWEDAAEKIKRVDRRRAVTLEFTAPAGQPLEQVVKDLDGIIENLRKVGAISPAIFTEMEGSAGKLNVIRKTLLGDNTLTGFLSSSMFLSFAAVYLLMCVLFQSWSKPFIIMFTVPLATFGGFLGLALVHHWSLVDPYMPVQNLDVLTLLGFVILAGVVVNNAILIVAQADIWLNPSDGSAPMEAKLAIAKAAQSRIRPIFMSMLTSVGGMLPLVLIPGSGSELYRGLGAVVVGGMLLSTLFTLVLIPILMSIFEDIKNWNVLRKVSPVSLILLVAVALSGCQSTNIAKDESTEHRTVDLPSEFSEIFSNESYEAGDSYWAMFEDQSLNKLIDIALQQNLDLKVWDKRIEQSRALLGQVDSDRWPSVEGSAGISRSKNSVYNQKEATRWSTGFQASWELDIFSRVRNASKAQQASLDSVIFQGEHLRRVVVADVIRLYWQYRQFEQQLKLQEEIIGQQQQQLAFAQNLLDYGQSSEDRVDAQAIILESLKSGESQIRQNLAQVRLSLENLLGVKPQSLMASLPAASSYSTGRLPVLGLPADLLRRRPDIAAIESQVLTETAKLGIAKAEMYPRLSLTGTLSWTALQANELFKSSTQSYGIGPALSWRLFEGQRIRQEQRAQLAKLEEMELTWRKTVQDAVFEMEQLLKIRRDIETRLSHLERQLDFQEKQVQRQETLLAHGQVTQRDVLSAEMQLADLGQLHVALNMSLAINTANCCRALGGEDITSR